MSRLSTAWKICSVVLALSVVAAGGGAVRAGDDVGSYLKSAQQLMQKNDLRGAEIQLRNAGKLAPKNGEIRLALAKLYLRLNAPNFAEGEAIAAQARGVAEPQIAPVLAQALLEEGNIGDLLRRVPAGDRPAKIESQVRTFRGIAELSLGDRDQARAMFEDAQRLDPKAIEPKIAMVRLLLISSKTVAAETLIRQALAISPDNSQALDTLGVALALKGEPAQALNAFNQAVAHDPHNLLALLDRANINANGGSLDSAQRDINAVLATTHASPVAMYLQALVDAKRGDFKKADSDLSSIRAVMDRLPEAFYLAGAVKFKLNEMEQAEAYLQRFIAKQSDQPNAYKLLAAIALRRGDSAAAIELLKKGLIYTPGDPGLIGMLGEAYAKHGDAVLATALLEKAVQGEPANPALQTQLALSHIASGEPDAGLSQLNDVFNSAGGMLAGPALVLTALKLEHYDDAAATAQALVKREPGNIVYEQLLGTARIAQRNYAEAERIFLDLIKKHPELGAARRNLAQIYLVTNREQMAEDVFRQRLATVPNDVESLVSLAALRTAAKDYAAALVLLRKAQEAAPTNFDPSGKIVALFAQQKKWPDAMREAKSLAVANPDSVPAQDILGRVYVQSGDSKSAVALYKQALIKFPSSAVIWTDYAGALVAEKEKAAAIEALKKAVALEPTNNRLKQQLVALAYQNGGAAAAAAVAKSLPTGPDDAPGDLFAAQVIAEGGNPNAAIAMLQKQLSASPSSAVVMKVVNIYRSTNQIKAAIATLETWIKGHPTDVDAHFSLAQLYGISANYAAALSQFEWLVHARPSDPVILNNLAWLYSQTKDPRALPLAQKAATLAPDSPSIADTLGWILTMQGQAQSGLKYLQMASAKSPADFDIQYHFAVALSKTSNSREAQAVLQNALSSRSNFDSRQAAQKLLSDLSAGKASK